MKKNMRSVLLHHRTASNQPSSRISEPRILTTSQARAYAINNLGEVAIRVHTTNATYVGVWKEGLENNQPTLTDLGIGSAYVRAMNDFGQLAGYYSGQGYYEFRYTPGEGIEQFYSDPAIDYGTASSGVEDINNAGQFVGYTEFYGGKRELPKLTAARHVTPTAWGMKTLELSGPNLQVGDGPSITMVTASPLN